ncbi:MAG TPA: serine hydrolase, partial [Spirochaetia bacterium]|nr:serine hydrolase [Spirochaetia bacterium]
MNLRHFLLLSGLLSLPAAHAQPGPDLNALDAYLAKAVTDFDQPGLAVGIVKDGRLIWSKG